tara:strand:+ start:305 stop:487 length:183 start_codon:yes stop_codon:yes gene_type:complete
VRLISETPKESEGFTFTTKLLKGGKHMDVFRNKKLLKKNSNKTESEEFSFTTKLLKGELS